MIPAAEVDALLTARAHPLGATVAQIRAVLRDVPGAVESVKWNAPNYALADDFATMQLRRDDAVQLVLHTGAEAEAGSSRDRAGDRASRGETRRP